MRGLGGTTVIVAALVFGVSAVLFGATVVDAVWVDPPAEGSPGTMSPAASQEAGSSGGPVTDAPDPTLPAEETAAPRFATPTQGGVYPKVTEREILDAVNQDLFQPDRTPSLTPYLLPSERPEPARESRNNRRQRRPDLRLVGTALAGDLSFALIQLEDSLPVLFALGETVEGYTLASVTEESITLATEDAQFTYPVMEPDRGRGSNDRNDRNARDRTGTAEREIQAMQQRLQQALRGLNQRGARMNYQFITQPGAAGQNQVIELQPGRMIFQGNRPGGGAATVTIRGRGGSGGGGGIQ
jgi:hypothetical protein